MSFLCVLRRRSSPGSRLIEVDPLPQRLPLVRLERAAAPSARHRTLPGVVPQDRPADRPRRIDGRALTEPGAALLGQPRVHDTRGRAVQVADLACEVAGGGPVLGDPVEGVV